MTKIKRSDLKRHFKAIRREGARDAACAEIEEIFETYAALSDDEDKDQLCEAEFGQYLRAEFGDALTDNSIGKLFRRFDTDGNDDIC